MIYYHLLPSALLYISFIGSLKAGFVTERSELGSCRAFRLQYPIFIGIHTLCLGVTRGYGDRRCYFTSAQIYFSAAQLCYYLAVAPPHSPMHAAAPLVLHHPQEVRIHLQPTLVQRVGFRV